MLAELTAVACALVGGVFFAFSGFGTAAACVAVLVTGPSALQVAGAVVYLVGTVGVTVAANVPLNDALEREAATWPRYRRTWTRWNHLRTAAALAAAVLLVVD